MHGLFELTVIILGLIFFVCYLEWIKWNRRLRGYALPPGPKGLPLVGSLFSIPTSRAWLVYKEWAHTYGTNDRTLSDTAPLTLWFYCAGDIIFFQVMQTPMIVVSSFQLAQDLMERRAAIYSDKPVSTIDKL